MLEIQNGESFVPAFIQVEEVIKGHEVSRLIPAKILEQGIQVMAGYLEMAVKDSDPKVERRVVSKIKHMGDAIDATFDIISLTPEIEWNVPQALTIGFLHDIGRLPQGLIGKYEEQNSNNGNDGNRYHGEEGAKIVQEFDFLDTGIDKNAVIEAIARHDLLSADKNKPYVELVRDADRVALFRHIINSGFFTDRIKKQAPVSPLVKAEFLVGEMVKNNHMEEGNVSDEIIRMLAWNRHMAFSATSAIIRNEHLIDVLEEQLKLSVGELDPEIKQKIDELKKGMN
jgi:hypothetical protein